MIQSLQRAFLLLDLLDRAGEPGLTLGAVARESGLKAPTARNILKSLTELGVVRQAPGSRLYAPGPRALSMGRKRRLHQVIRESALPVLRQFRDQAGETIVLAVYDAGFRNTLASVESAQVVRVGANEGKDLQFYPTATGRVLLALLPEAERQALVGRLGPPPPQAWPGAEDPAAFHRALERIRASGECRVEPPLKHARALAVALDPGVADVFVSLGSYYPLSRDCAGRSDELVARLREAAARIREQFERSWS